MAKTVSCDMAQDAIRYLSAGTKRVARGGVVAVLLVALGLVIGGCASKPEVLPQDEFWNSVSALCGKTYPGRVITDTTSSPTFGDRPITLHVRECDESEITMPVIIGSDAWVELKMSRQDGRLVLTHTHGGREGMPDGYGGATRAGGTAVSQDFYADEFTALLQDGAEDTIWTIEIRPGAVISYALHREGTDRRFRAVFDLARGRPAATALR